MSTLNALGDFDFTVTSQQRNSSHFAQVHANGIVCLIQCAGSEIQLDAFFSGFAVEFLFATNFVECVEVLVGGGDDFDTGSSECRKQFIQIFSGSTNFER